jgi:UDP-glucose 4-epimerase
MGHEVVVLDDLSGGSRDNVSPRAAFVEGSMLDHELVARLFAEHPFDYVYHLAAYAAEGLSHFIKRFNYENNLIGSVNLINASVNAGTVKCFVFTSSIAVYGENQLPMTEDLVPMPEDPYGIAKLAVELDLKESFTLFGLPYIVFRPHNVYGERQNIGDRYRNVVGIFMNQIMRGEELTVFGDGSQTRAFSHVSEVAPVIARAVTREAAYGETFNIGADRPYPVNELVEVVKKTMKSEVGVRYLPARKEVVHAYASHDKVRRHFGDLVTSVPLEVGVERMARWVESHGSRESRRFTHIEVGKNMPACWE